MKAACVICQRKQGALFQDFPLSEDHADFRICANCADKLARVGRATDEMEVLDVVDFFAEQLKGDLRPEVAAHLKKELQAIKERAVIEKERKEKREEEERQQKIREEEAAQKRYAIAQLAKKLRAEYMLTTGYSFEGYAIKKYVGVISGQVVLGTGFLSEFAASLSDFWGVESGTFAKKLELAKEAALTMLIEKSIEQGGSAIIGVDFDYITFGNNMIGVVANGTSVIIEERKP